MTDHAPTNDIGPRRDIMATETPAAVPVAELQQLSDAGRRATALHVLLQHDKTFRDQFKAAVGAGDTKAENDLLNRVGFELADTVRARGKGAPPPTPEFCFHVWRAKICVVVIIE
jgi:hypothetical protein